MIITKIGDHLRIMGIFSQQRHFYAPVYLFCHRVPPIELVSLKRTNYSYYCYFTIEAKLENWYKIEKTRKKKNMLTDNSFDLYTGFISVNLVV